MLIAFTVCTIALIYVCSLHLQWRRHNHRLARIPIRIHVNGTRGKSTVTRLIAAGLRAGGTKTMAKTTGTTPRLILPDGSECPILRPNGPTIHEQVSTIDVACRHGVQAVVLECMAVNPEFQWISEHEMIRSQIGVITNVRLDHTDLMGARLDQIASCLANTIPRNGKLVTPEVDSLGILRARAERAGAEVVRAKPEAVTDDDLDGFADIPFRENVATALEVCRLLNIDRADALRGMQEALPDPGVLRVSRCEFDGKHVLFANALAANDITSTRQIWNGVTSLCTDAQKVLLLCSRRDRPARDDDFVKAIRQGWDYDMLILAGRGTAAVRRRLLAGGVAASRIVDLTASAPASVPGDIVRSLPERSVVVAAGNIVGLGKTIADFFHDGGIDERIHPDVVAGVACFPDPV